MIRLYSLYRALVPLAPTIVYNDATGVSFSQTNSAYRVALITHLPGNVNQGNHCVYLDVLDGDGRPLSNPPLHIGYTWEGRGNDEAAPPQPLDKGPLDWSAGNVVLYKGMVASVWLQDGDRMVSDVVSGLRSDISADDPATGNSLYHHSFYVVFRAASVAPVTPPALTMEERMLRLERLHNLA